MHGRGGTGPGPGSIRDPGAGAGRSRSRTQTLTYARRPAGDTTSREHSCVHFHFGASLVTMRLEVKLQPFLLDNP